MRGKQPKLTPKLIVEAYCQGYFPMARIHDSTNIDWVKPYNRAQLPIENFHVPRRLKTFLNTCPYEVTVDQAFEDVIVGCAQLTETRTETWINQDIMDVFCTLHAQGLAHSVEVWEDEGGNRTLVGGVYGLSLGAAFFAESMFSRRPNASKVALVHLAKILKQAGYQIFDVQFINPHLEQFGVYEIPQEEYEMLLHEALQHAVLFP